MMYLRVFDFQSVRRITIDIIIVAALCQQFPVVHHVRTPVTNRVF